MKCIDGAFLTKQYVFLISISFYFSHLTFYVIIVAVAVSHVFLAVWFMSAWWSTRVCQTRTYVSHLDAPAAVGSSLEVVQRSKTELGSTSHATVSARFLDQSEQPTQYAQQRHRNSGRGQYINSSHTPRDRCVLMSLCSVSIPQTPLEMLNCKHSFGLNTHI